MDRIEAMEEMNGGRSCAQCVLKAFEEITGYDADETDKMAALLGGGMGMGQTCGAVSGALIAMGMAGCGREDAAEFTRIFADRFGSCMCSELLAAKGADQESEYERCPEFVAGAVNIAETFME